MKFDGWTPNSLEVISWGQKTKLKKKNKKIVTIAWKRSLVLNLIDILGLNNVKVNDLKKR